MSISWQQNRYRLTFYQLASGCSNPHTIIKSHLEQDLNVHQCIFRYNGVLVFCTDLRWKLIIRRIDLTLSYNLECYSSCLYYNNLLGCFVLYISI